MKKNEELTHAAAEKGDKTLPPEPLKRLYLTMDWDDFMLLVNNECHSKIENIGTNLEKRRDCPNHWFWISLDWMKRKLYIDNGYDIAEMEEIPFYDFAKQSLWDFRGVEIEPGKTISYCLMEDAIELCKDMPEEERSYNEELTTEEMAHWPLYQSIFVVMQHTKTSVKSILELIKTKYYDSCYFRDGEKNIP